MNKNVSFVRTKKEKTRAFTLVEIMFSVFILGVIGAILTSLMINSAKSISWSIDKSLITNDFRKFTTRITQDTYNANFAYLYPAFNFSVQNTNQNNNQRSDRVAVGFSGDCLVLVQTQAFPNVNSQKFFSRFVVYYRDGNGAEKSVVRREFVLPQGVNSTANIDNAPNFFEDFLNTQINRLSPPEIVLESTRGHSTDDLAPNGLFFERLTSEAFLVNGEIINGVKSPSTQNTYNLTISTRG